MYLSVGQEGDPSSKVLWDLAEIFHFISFFNLIYLL